MLSSLCCRFGKHTARLDEIELQILCGVIIRESG
jgi:hypothetical protein